MVFVPVAVFGALALEYDVLLVIFGGLVVECGALALVYCLMFVLAVVFDALVVVFDALVQTPGSVDDSDTTCFHFVSD